MEKVKLLHLQDMKLHFFVFVSILFFGLSANGQHSIVVLNELTQEPIDQLAAKSNSGQVWLSNRAGTIVFSGSQKASDEIRFSHISFISRHLTWGDVQKEDTLYFRPSVFELDAAEISDVDTVFQDATVHVGDFEFISGNRLLLLAYTREDLMKPHQLAKVDIYEDCQLLIQDENRTITDTLNLIGSFTGLHQDPSGSLYLEGVDKYWEIRLPTERARMALTPITTKHYDEEVLRYVARWGSLEIRNNAVDGFPLFDYYWYDRDNQLMGGVYTCQDEWTMEILRSEYKYMDGRDKLEAYRAELRTGVDKEIVAAYMTGFEESNYFAFLPAPIFERTDTLWLFEHNQKELVTITKTDTLTQALQYHESRGIGRWSEQVLLDTEEGTFYTVFNKGKTTTLATIDLRTGELGKRQLLINPFVKEVQIKGGNVYYTYRPFASEHKFFLCKESIN